MSDVNELLEQAIKETENLNEGEVFLVKDLFKGYVCLLYTSSTRALCLWLPTTDIFLTG